MAIMTVYQMVEDILNDMDSDPVDTISDTEESRQVTEILKKTYFKIIDSREWPFLFNMFQVVETSASTPTEMTLPATVTRLKYIKYNGTLVSYLEPQRFMNLLDARNTGDANVDAETDSSGITLKVINDANPTYYTIFQERRVVFDSYDSGTESFLATANTQGYGQVYPSWTDDDGTFTPTLPVDMFNFLLEDAKSTAFLVLKQANNPKADFYANTLRANQLDAGWKGRKNYPIRDVSLVAPQQGNRGDNNNAS